MTIEVPYEWRSLLRAVQDFRPEAVIGGGCLRDIDNGREVKDIDIFVNGSKAEEMIALREKMSGKLSKVEFAEIDSSNWYPVGDGNDVVGHFEATFAEIEFPVQIIMVNFDTSRICERFDFGICRISFDGDTLTVTDEYRWDKRCNVFKLRRQRSDQELVASVHRYARLSHKYPGWRFELFDEIVDAASSFSDLSDFD
jgi:hypothetical protein